MEEKIIHLLKLCLQAQANNHNIDFSCNVLGINLWHFSEYIPGNYNPVLITHFDIPYDMQDYEEYNIAEKYVKNLVEKGK